RDSRRPPQEASGLDLSGYWVYNLSMEDVWNDGAVESSRVTTLPDEDQRPVFPIVAIGASAGGLAALETVFERLPVDLGAAYVVLQHLSPDFKSHMTELLGRVTSLPVTQAVDR